VIQRGQILKQGRLEDLIQNKEKLIIRMSTQDEVQKAYAILQGADFEGMQRPGAVQLETVPGDLPKIVAAIARKSAPLVSRMLAEHQLFPAEIQVEAGNLEDVFLELTNQPATAQTVALTPPLITPTAR